MDDEVGGGESLVIGAGDRSLLKGRLPSPAESGGDSGGEVIGGDVTDMPELPLSLPEEIPESGESDGPALSLGLLSMDIFSSDDSDLTLHRDTLNRK